MSSNKFIVVVGSISYGNPFVSFGKVTNKVKLLLKKTDRVKAVVFTGGEDISPSMYGGRECKLSYTSTRRDNIEERIFEFCIKHDIKMIGICRGLQFINVMASGKMLQHVNGHAGSLHQILYPSIGKRHMVNSLHHQMVILPESAIIVGWSYPSICTITYDENGIRTKPPKYEIEAAVFPEYNAFGVQFHPEMMDNYEEGRIFYIKMIEHFLESSMNDFIDEYGYTGEKTKCQVK